MASLGHMPLIILLWMVGVVEKALQSIGRERKISERKKEVLLAEWDRGREAMGEAETTDGHR